VGEAESGAWAAFVRTPRVRVILYLVRPPHN